jgi:hypothetical protein
LQILRYGIKTVFLLNISTNRQSNLLTNLNPICMKEYDKIKQLVDALQEDVAKFAEKGNAAAGTRVRKGLQDIKRACQEMRDAVQAIKKGE